MSCLRTPEGGFLNLFSSQKWNFDPNLKNWMDEKQEEEVVDYLEQTIFISDSQFA